MAALLVLVLIAAFLPVELFSAPADDCPRVGVYIDRVQALAERAAPVIMRSGNERAIGLLQMAAADLRNANSAYDSGHCRAAFNLAQQADSEIRRALRMISRDRID